MAPTPEQEGASRDSIIQTPVPLEEAEGAELRESSESASDTFILEGRLADLQNQIEDRKNELSRIEEEINTHETQLACLCAETEKYARDLEALTLLNLEVEILIREKQRLSGKSPDEEKSLDPDNESLFSFMIELFASPLAKGAAVLVLTSGLLMLGATLGHVFALATAATSLVGWGLFSAGYYASTAFNSAEPEKRRVTFKDEPLEDTLYSPGTSA